MDDGDYVRDLIERTNNPIWAAEMKQWDLVWDRLDFNNTTQVLDALIMVLKEYLNYLMQRNGYGIDKLFRLANRIIGHRDFKFLDADRSVIIYTILSDADSKRKFDTAEMLLQKVHSRGILHSFSGCNVISLEFLEKYVAADQLSNFDYASLLSSIIAGKNWQPSIDGNRFVSVLVNHFVNLGGEKRLKIGQWINETIDHGNFNVSAGENAIVSHMLEKSFSAYHSEMPNLSILINSWITICMKKDSFQVSGIDDKIVEDLTTYFLLLSETSRKAEVHWRQTIIGWMKSIKEKHEGVDQILKSMIKSDNAQLLEAIFFNKMFWMK